MKIRSTTLLAAVFGLSVLPARAQPADNAAAFESSLQTVLSVISFGGISLQTKHAVVTRNGPAYQLSVPLKGLAPPDNTLTAMGDVGEDGTMALTALSFPSHGTVIEPSLGAARQSVAFSIGQQAITGRIDPSLDTPSTFTFDLRRLRLESQGGPMRGAESLDRYQGHATLERNADGRLSLGWDGQARDMNVTAATPAGLGTQFVARSVRGSASVQGLDHDRLARLVTALGRLQAARQDAPPADPLANPPAHATGAATPLSAIERQALTGVIDALSGLASRFSVNETLTGVRIAAGPKTATLRRLRFDTDGTVTGQVLHSDMAVALSGLSLPPSGTPYDPFLPHHLRLDLALDGVKTTSLLPLLRATVDQDEPAGLLRARWLALASEPGAEIDVRTLSFDAGPLNVTASARMLRGAQDEPLTQARVSATGLDALIADAQTQPALRRMLPALFVMKGMGRPDGRGGLVWDIRLDNGNLQINGTPFGQAPAARR